MTYMDRVNETCIKASEFSMSQIADHAWDNKKRKVYKMYTPRGSAFRRMEKIEWSLIEKVALNHLRNKCDL